MPDPLPAEREAAFWSGVENARRFFMGEADVQRALERLARVLDEKGIPYAIIGALALNEWGHRRVTVDIDLLLTPEGLRSLKAEVLGRGYVEKSPGAVDSATSRQELTSMSCWPGNTLAAASRSRCRSPTPPASRFGVGAWPCCRSPV